MRRADGKPINVLVVDDEPVLAELVSMALRYEGWDIATAGDGATAIALARENPPDVVVLDVMLPDMSGLDVLHELRDQIPGLPLLLLTAKDSVEDRIAGLTAGGDDYVTKPFSLEEVVLRLRALLRRTGVADETGGAQIVVGDLVLDEDSHEVTRAGEPITLTATEFELLRFMMRNAKRVLSKAQILDRVWSYDFGGRSNIVELYVSYLRKKIDSGREPMIHTLAGRRVRPQATALSGRWRRRRRTVGSSSPRTWSLRRAAARHPGGAARRGVRRHRHRDRVCAATLSDAPARQPAGRGGQALGGDLRPAAAAAMMPSRPGIRRRGRYRCRVDRRASAHRGSLRPGGRTRAPGS